MGVIHISGAEAARDFASLLAQLRAGAEVVIEDDLTPPVVLRVVEEPYTEEAKGWTLAESIRLPEAHAKERSYDLVMDADFAADLEGRIRARKPRDTSACACN